MITTTTKREDLSGASPWKRGRDGGLTTENKLGYTIRGSPVKRIEEEVEGNCEFGLSRKVST